MKFINSIAEYLREIDLPPSKDLHFYAGRHEEWMATIKPVLKPVKHELFSISVIKKGDRIIKLDHSVTKKVFVRSHFKAIEWDFTNTKIQQGIFIIFSNHFIQNNVLWKNFLLDFPFFRHSAFFNEDLATSMIDELYDYCNKIYECYYSDSPEKYELINAYLQIVLLLMKQEYRQRINISTTVTNAANNRLLEGFEVLLIKTLENPEPETDFRQASFYASQLYVHVNHLNAVVKQITGKTTSEVIQEYIIHRASAALRQSDIPIKEIAYRYNFSATTHFTAFFKKHTGLTPKQYRGLSHSG